MNSQAIVLCTRDRPDDLHRCLASVLVEGGRCASFGGLSVKVARKAVTGVRPTGFNAARFFVKGLVLSTRAPIDKAHKMYAPLPVIDRTS